MQITHGGNVGLCSGCQKDLLWHKNPHCPQCGLLWLTNLTCGHSLKSPPEFDATQSLITYNFPLAALLQPYKYGSMLNLSHSFADLMTEYLLLNDIKAKNIDLIIAMPMRHNACKNVALIKH